MPPVVLRHKDVLVIMIDQFILYALLAGLGIAITAGPLGCVVVWRRMAYFGDTLAHAALLGVVLSLALQWLPVIGVVITGLLLTVVLFWLERKQELSTDTLLGILSHSALAIGMIAIVLLQSKLPSLDVMALLFGDILAVTGQELVVLYIGVVLVLLVYARIWRDLVSLSSNEDLARIDGVNVSATRFVFMVLLAVVIAFAIKLVGVLLITAMLIIPAASARLFSHSPQQMILLSVVIAVLAVLGGLAMSLRWDLPTGPAIVLAAAILFAASRSIKSSPA